MKAWLAAVTMAVIASAQAPQAPFYGIVRAVGDLSCIGDCVLTVESNRTDVSAPLDIYNTVAWTGSPDALHTDIRCKDASCTAVCLHDMERKGSWHRPGTPGIHVMNYRLQRHLDRDNDTAAMAKLPPPTTHSNSGKDALSLSIIILFCSLVVISLSAILLFVFT